MLTTLTYTHPKGVIILSKITETDNFKKAVNFYLANPTFSSRAVARKFCIGKDVLNNYLKNKGILRPKKDNSFDDNFFKVIDSEEKAYWLGFIFADGSVQYGKKSALEISLKGGDIKHLQKFKKAISFKGDIKTRDVFLESTGKTYPACRMFLYGTAFVESLISLGCIPSKSLTVEFPQISKPLWRHFIRGYVDGNGSIYTIASPYAIGRIPTLEIIGSFPILNAIQAYFIEELGTSKVKIYDQKVVVGAYRKSRGQALRILMHLYSDATCFLDRKYEKYMELLATSTSNCSEKLGEKPRRLKPKGHATLNVRLSLKRKSHATHRE